MDKPRKGRRSSGSNSGKESKNVSHVPCKFYRQGVCQAAENCPFSHAQDSTTSGAVCKYFQKGNCKFGAKCALAHVTPDGKRVKKRGSAGAAAGATGATAGPTTGTTAGAGSTGTSTGVATGATGGQLKPNATSFSSGTPTASSSGGASGTSGAGSSGASGASSFGSLSGSLNQSGSLSSGPLNPSSGSIGTGRAPSTPSITGGMAFASTPPVVGSPLGIPLVNRPSTTGNSRAGSFHFESSLFPSRSGSMSTSTSRAAAIWADRPKNPMAFEGSAVTDDEDDGFEEDLVPSTLSELLTPQERERRNSRHSSALQPRPDSTELWSNPRFHRASFGRSERPDVKPSPEVKVEPIGASRGD